MLLDRPILFFSDHCQHSKNFIDILMKSPDLFENFIRVNIDPDITTRRRPEIFYKIQQELNFKITEIPTIIVSKGEYILSGEEAFKWLESQKAEENTELIAYNPVEMGSFSDIYATFGSSDMNEDVKAQAFKFIGDPDIPINTPEEGSIEPLKEKERENFDNIHKQNNAPNLNNFNQQRPKISNKQKDFEQRLQQMILDRK